MKSHTLFNPSLCEVTQILKAAFATGADVHVKIFIDEDSDAPKTVNHFPSEAEVLGSLC